MKITAYFSILLFIILAYYGCHDTYPKDSSDFFFKPQYKWDSFNTLPYDSPDSTIKFIRDEVRPQRYGWACETAFYHIKEESPDSILFKHIDLYELWFPHDTVFAFTHTLRAKLFLRQDKYDTAVICLQRAYNYSNRIHSALRLGDVSSLRGELYSRKGNYPEAIEHLLQAYKICNELPFELRFDRIFESMIDLGNAYYISSDYASAQVWYLKAWNYARQYDWAKGFKIKAAAAVADNYLHLNQLDSAKLMIDTAFYYQNLYQNFYDQASRHYILAQILAAQNNCIDALANFWKAKRQNLKVSNSLIVNRYNEGLGDGYLCNGQLDSAIWFYRQALLTPDTARQAAIHQQLSHIYAQKRNYALAYEEEKESRRLSDKIFTIEKDKEIGQLQAKNDLESRERLIAEIENGNKISRLFIIIGILILIVLLIVSINVITRQKQVRLLAEQEKKLLEAREQLKTKALEVIKQKFDAQKLELEEYNKQLNLKDLLIQKLELKLTVDKTESTEPIGDVDLQNLKILTTEDWRKFRLIFEQRYPLFILHIVERFPKLTGAELRLLVLIKIGFDANEMANVLGISSASIYKSRYRLRKKLGLVEEDDLEKFAQGV